jgi:hypothetical protein
MLRLRTLLPLLCLLFAPTTFADALPQAQVPAPLKPWIGWALHGHEDAVCPLEPEGEAHVCLWPSRLQLKLDENGGKFSQAVQTWRELPMPLPGNKDHWPQDVRVDGKPAPVVEVDGHPAVWLKPGAHAIEGVFGWARLPESIAVPETTGLVALTLRGAVVASPSRGEGGLLWLSREQGDEEGESKLEVQVWRFIADEVPLRVVTRLQLDVSGKSREVVLGKALLDGFVPVSLESELPARLEPDGRLRVQVRPGKFKLELAARRREPVTQLSLAAQPEATPPAPILWSAEEIWVFVAQPDLRAVEIVGVPSIDPAQTTLPEEWRRYPAYRMRPGDTMQLRVARRGDEQAPPDQLTLQRTLWLDFDGKGLTARDRLTGTLTRSDRLEMPEPSVLGRVDTQGHDQLITRLGPESAPGVELREGNLSLEAESREPLRAGSLSAVAWSHGVRALSARLNLPPGWRLLHASGADEVSPTWLQSWSLLDLFLLLLASLAAGRLFGWPMGAAMFVGLGLALPEGAPKWLWLFPLAAEALLRVVPADRLRRFLVIARGVALVVLLLALAPFAARHLRVNLYPSLAHEQEHGFDLPGTASEPALEQVPDRFAALAKPESAPTALQIVGAGGVAAAFDESLGAEDKPSAKRGMAHKLSLGSISVQGNGSARAGYQQQLDLAKIDPNAIAQTGPGLPEWTWSTVSFGWSGPVDADARVQLWLLSPWMNLLLAFARVLLLALLWLKLLAPALGGGAGLGGLRAWLSRRPKTPPAAVVAGALLFAIVGLGSPLRADEIPNDAVLTELGSRLTASPDCGDHCVASPRMIVEAGNATLRLRIEIDAAALASAPLPGSLSGWSPESVLLDGKPAPALQRRADGALVVALEPGTHQLVLEGPLPPRDELALSLPLPPKHVEAHLTGWTLEGLHDDGVPEETLQLLRVERGAAKSQRLEPGQLPPSVEVERALILGMTWQVQTRVTRKSPSGSPFTLEIPLLPGESITSADVRAQDGKAQASFGPHTDQIAWTSTLAQAPKVTLVALDDPAVAEVWRLEIAPAWHVDAKGIPPVHQAPQAQRVPLYRPWPGESLALEISRPKPVAGASLTIRSSLLDVTPGVRTSDVTLTLHLSTSRGGPATFQLPAGAELQSLQLDGADQPLRQEGTQVTLSLSPGERHAKIVWREPSAMKPLFRTPRPDLTQPSVNSTIQLRLPSRWILFAGGPRLGPAVLIWSYVLVMLLCAFGLSRLGSTPLRTYQWALLALGLTQIDLLAAAAVAAWFLLLGWRRDAAERITSPRRFDLLQLALVVWTVVAGAVLILSIERGLLGTPEMQIAGNGSTAWLLQWFADRTGPQLPAAWVFSLPLFVYRIAMLAWALWLALAMVRWLPWAWASFASGGAWRAWPKREKKVKVEVEKAVVVETTRPPTS